jgi:hypothetical protein
MNLSSMNNFGAERGLTPGVKTYTLYLSRWAKITSFIPVGIFTLMAILILSGIFKNAKGGPPEFIGIFLLIMAAWFWYFILSLPYQIKVYGNVEIEFVSLLHRRRVSPMDIVSIKSYGSQFGFLLVKTNRGKIKLLNQFDGFHEFIANLKSANSSIELRGC